MIVSWDTGTPRALENQWCSPKGVRAYRTIGMVLPSLINATSCTIWNGSGISLQMEQCQSDQEGWLRWSWFQHCTTNVPSQSRACHIQMGLPSSQAEPSLSQGIDPVSVGSYPHVRHGELGGHDEAGKETGLDRLASPPRLMMLSTFECRLGDLSEKELGWENLEYTHVIDGEVSYIRE